jgi:hypothetical protein
MDKFSFAEIAPDVKSIMHPSLRSDEVLVRLSDYEALAAELARVKDREPPHCASCSCGLARETKVDQDPRSAFKHGQPLSTEERAIVDQYLIDVTCPRCYSVKHLCVCPKETKVITEHAVDPTPFSNGAALRESGFRAAAKTKCAECVYDVRNPDWCEICGTQSSAEEAGAKP